MARRYAGKRGPRLSKYSDEQLEAELERALDGDGPVGEVTVVEHLHWHRGLIIVALGPVESADDRFAVGLGDFDAFGTDRLAQLRTESGRVD